MKIGQLDLRRWTYRDIQLDKPLTIIRRLAALPLLLAGRVVMVTAVALGWGLDEAAEAWRDLP